MNFSDRLAVSTNSYILKMGDWQFFQQFCLESISLGRLVKRFENVCEDRRDKT